MPDGQSSRSQHARIERHVEVRLRDVGSGHPFISSRAETINVSDHGLLMEVPSALDACVGQEVIASLHWDGGDFESPAEIVRFESPFWRDGTKSVMGLRLVSPLPSHLLVASEPSPHGARHGARAPDTR